MWGEETNTRGEELEDIVSQLDLTVANYGTHPTFVGRDTATCVDVTLTLNTEVNEWQVTDET